MDLRRGKTEEQCLTDMLNSLGDYLSTQQEGSWIRAIYPNLLQRAITPGETIGWLQALQHGVTYNSIAKAILESNEYLGLLVSGWFQRYLLRSPSPGEVNAFVGALQSGVPRVTLIAGIISSRSIGLPGHTMTTPHLSMQSLRICKAMLQTRSKSAFGSIGRAKSATHARLCRNSFWPAVMLTSISS